MNTPVAIFPSTYDTDGVALAWRRAGATVRRHLTVEDDPWDLSNEKLILEVTIESTDDAVLVVGACARGIGLLGRLALEDADAARAFLRDLHRIGPVQRVDRSELFDGLPLSSDEQAVLRALGSGASVRETADALFISKRTAERRVASARKALGVRTTAEAVTKVAGLPRDEMAVFVEFPSLDPLHTDDHPVGEGKLHG